MTPKAALSLDKAGRAKLRANVLGSQKQGNRAAKPPHKIHTAVRIKINKSVLGKSTTPSWSSKIYKIEQIYPGRGPMEHTDTTYVAAACAMVFNAFAKNGLWGLSFLFFVLDCHLSPVLELFIN